VLNELKSNLSSSLVYIKEYIFFNLSVILIVYLLVEKVSVIIPLIILLTILGLVVLTFIGKRRNKELEEIKEIINNIRKNYYNNAEEIVLDKHLLSLQKVIKKMFKKTKSDIEYLQRLQKMRSQFLANVSHELRTPIFTIQGYIETLLHGAINDPKVNLQFLKKANQHTINLSNLLNDLIDISMIESGEMRMSFGYFKVKDFFLPILQELKPLAEAKKIELKMNNIDGELSLFGDRDKLKQVMVNLIQNSIKYTEKGMVEILVEEEPRFGKIIVRDTGIGIPEKDLDRIFERFYRVDKARSRAVGGTGLGLAIVKHIVEAHNSQILVKSEINKGSEFSFKLRK
jgi:two-component system, OmpR family, phosphate regulon sensor histidine kinase PhoR